MNVDQIISALRAERDRLDRAIAALEGGGSYNRATAIRGNGRRKRRLTPEGRRRLSEMMKKRWAERRKKTA